MTVINNPSKQMQNGDNVTVYNNTVGTVTETFTFPTSQETVVLSNKGSKNITYTIGANTGTLTPSTFVKVTGAFSSLSLSSEQGTQAFEVWSEEAGNLGATPEAIQSLTSQMADIATTAKKYNAYCDGTHDDTVFIQNAVNDVSSKGGGVVYLLPNHLINGTISIPSNIAIRALTRTTIKSTSNNSGFTIPANSDNVTIEGITFDYGSTNASTAVYVYENVTNLKLENLRFKNMYNSDSTVGLKVIHLRTGVTGLLNNLVFYNIKGVGNGTITDNGGSINCINTDNFGVTVFNNFNLIISNVRFDTIYNVDGNGNPIIEDSDMIHFNHGTSVDGIINVSNVTARNINKRVIKIQGQGVNINNVIVEGTIEIPWVIAAMSNNANISNVVVKGNVNRVIEFLDATNVNVNNVQVNSNYAGTIVYDNLFNIYDSSNINISQVSGTGYGGFLIYGNNTKNITVDKVNLNLSAQFLFIQDRNSAGTGYTGGVISNINFTRCSFTLTSTTYNSVLFDINGTGSVNPIQQLQFRDLRITANQLYQFGLIRVKNATDVLFENPYIVNNSALTNPTLFIINGNTTVQLRKIGISGTATTAQFQVFDTASVLVTRSTISNALLSGTTCKLELEKTPNVTMAYSSSATSAQLTTS
jgi:hypothetical protein